MAYVLVGFAALWCSGTGWALDPRKPVSQYSHTLWRSEDGLLHNFIQAILQTKDGYLWLGTIEGLVRFDGAQFTVFHTQNTPALRHNSIVTLCEDRHGALWIGTSGGGITRYQAGAFTATYTTANGLPNNYVRTIYADRAGRLSITAHDGGLVRFENGRFHAFTTADDLPDNSMRTVLEDNRGRLWVGTPGGVATRQDGVWKILTPALNSAPHSVSAIAEDRDRTIWIGGAGGLDRLRGSEFLSFTSRDGLAHNLVTSLHVDAANTLWVGTRGMLSAAESVSLPVGEGNLEIQFTAIALGAPESVRFRFRLDGLDSDWVDAGRRRSAFYTNLAPGEYRFRAMAYSNDNVWPRQETSVMIRLRPRFHQTLWFYGICLLALVGAAAAAYRLHVRGIRSRYEAVLAERIRIGREIHDTLMQGVTGISLQLDAASRRLPAAPALAKQEIDRALRQLDEVLADARRCVLELRSGGERQTDLPAALRKLVESLTSGHAIEAQLTVEGNPSRLAPHAQEQLLRVAREAVTNAVVHSRARNLWVNLRFENGSVHLRVTDDGCGFDVHAPDNLHFGIVGMRERMSQLGGHLEIQSTPGKGAEVNVSAPLRT